jgi:hypothetical protein
MTNLSRLDLMRDAAKSFPVPLDASRVTHLRVWHCKYASLAGLSRFSNLQELVIATYPDATLDALAGLASLRVLHIVHLPKISDLRPLQSMKELQSLSLATLPSWDASRKRLTISGLEPLAALVGLQHVELLGVVTADKSLAALEGCRALVSARLHGYPTSEVQRFFEATRVANAFNPPTTFAS